MKNKKPLIGIFGLSVLSLATVATSATYAGFIYSQGVDPDVTIKRIVYLNANSSLSGGAWDKDGAHIGCFAWYRESTGQSTYIDHIGFFIDGAFMDEVSSGSHRYQITVPNEINYLIFVRCKTEATIPNWNDKWNQTEDIPFDSSANTEFKIEYWNGGYADRSRGSWIS